MELMNHIECSPVEPKNGFLRLLAPRIAYRMSDVRLGQPLDDAAFAPPAGCS